jgi:hypothetical protein
LCGCRKGDLNRLKASKGRVFFSGEKKQKTFTFLRQLIVWRIAGVFAQAQA